jgi:hypothetical protein
VVLGRWSCRGYPVLVWLRFVAVYIFSHLHTSKVALACVNARHALAKEALLQCLDWAERIKVYNLSIASEIWSRLREEYGNVSAALH